MSLFLLVLLIAVALGIIGAVVKGLLFLLVIGAVLFLLNLVAAGYRGGRSRGRRVMR